MRQIFKEYCEINRKDLIVFFPEFAIRNYFSNSGSEPFELGDFETLIADLSHAVIIFPEAAGSYAETGYFCVSPRVAVKTILALDSKYQALDSFISMGPAIKFNKLSKFRDVIQLSYSTPTFDDIIKRIERVPIQKYRKALSADKFSALTHYEKFCLIHTCVDILGIATIDDIIFMFRAMFKSQLSKSNVEQLTSILIGADFLRQVGVYGHYYVNKAKGKLLELRSGFLTEINTLRLELANVYSKAGLEFVELVEESHNAN